VVGEMVPLAENQQFAFWRVAGRLGAAALPGPEPLVGTNQEQMLAIGPALR
jgi:hypothetical protein